jgi:hypothetical protein
VKKTALIGATLALAVIMPAQPGWAAPRCATQGAAEAELAIRYMTDLMVASSACKNTVYAEFALRNREQIIRYQRAMIVHLHGTNAFDRWDTSLANEAAMRQGAVPPVQFCQQAAPMLQQAAALDVSGFRAYAAAQAAAGQSANCRKSPDPRPSVSIGRGASRRSASSEKR